MGENPHPLRRGGAPKRAYTRHLETKGLRHPQVIADSMDQPPVCSVVKRFLPRPFNAFISATYQFTYGRFPVHRRCIVLSGGMHQSAEHVEALKR